MKTIKIEYSNVGREKFSGIISYPYDGRKLDADNIAALAYIEVMKHLSSFSAETIYNIKTNEGIVTAGFHTVGSFKIIL